MDAKDAYQLYHSECLKAKNGCYPRPIMDFSKFEINPNREFFAKFADLCNRSGDLLNPTFYVRALAERYNGFFPPKAISAPSALRIYREFIEEQNKRKDPADIEKQVMNDCRFVISFCVANNLNDLTDYLNNNAFTIPSIISHVYSGRISEFFLACISNFMEISKNYPPDALTMIGKFDYKLQRAKIIYIDKCRRISDNLDYIITSSISKRKSQQNKEN